MCVKTITALWSTQHLPGTTLSSRLLNETLLAKGYAIAYGYHLSYRSVPWASFR